MSRRYFLSRIIQFLAVLLLVSFLIFSLLYLAPGDLTRTLIGTRPASPQTIAAITEKYRLNDPFLIQYWNWFTSILHGDWGRSVRSDIPVTAVLTSRIPLTLSLTAMSFVLAVGIGIPLGILAARRLGSRTDRGIVIGSVAGVSAPSFAIGMLLIYVLSVQLGWFPAYGAGEGFPDQLHHLALPAFSLALGVAAILIRTTRASVAREMAKDYVTFARSRGLPAWRISLLYAKNASIPIVTSAGLILGTLFGSTVLVETAFALPGIGQLLADSITFKDVPVVQAISLLVAAIIVAVTFLVDLLAAALSPAHRASVPGSTPRASRGATKTIAAGVHA